ncbi:protein unc-93 homolog A-like [Ylistrum balloti]|uniref:protein unc-93 homolog A-like n=1 Tax=Ylistrum balloti TaxID=509963 RepID=UPI0029058287|nr:protein unc-93 homolog A-like [Ylistrum balloti]
MEDVILDRITMTTDDKEGLVDMEEEDNIKTKRECYKILAVISTIWIFTFTAYSGLQNLESSLNPGVGTYSLAALTGGGLVSCLLAPAVLNFIGPKWALVISWVCLCVFIGGNYYPKNYILIPAAAIEGLSTGIMWTAQGIYVAHAAMQFSSISGESFDSVLSRFFGIFCMAFQSTQIWGNLISSAVLQHGHKPPPMPNTTLVCGADECPTSMSIPALPETTIIYILISIYMGLTVIGLFITLFLLKPLKKKMDQESIGKLLLSTVKLLATDINMALLVPFSFYTGLEQVIMYAEYTKSFVACRLGVEWVGYTMICFGVFNTMGSPLSGTLAKYVGRGLLLLIAFLLNLGVLAGLRFWALPEDPTFKQTILFFVFPGIWGLADSIWQTQSATLVGVAFKDKQEPAFANLRLFQAMGFTVAYLYSIHLCEFIKLYIAGAYVTLSMVLVAVVEIRLRRQASSNDIQMKSSEY